MYDTYTHGGDIYRDNVKGKIKYDFSININPLGMPESVIAAAKRGVELSDRYPDHMGEELCRKISEKEGCAEENIILGNGAAELIYALCMAEKPDIAFVPSPTFNEYASAVRAAAGNVEYINVTGLLLSGEATKNYSDKILSVIDVQERNFSQGILFICNPNNPTGTLFDRKELMRIAQVCEERNIRLVVDECFLPFTDKAQECTMIQETDRYKSLCIIRAFTKIYAMPGLRLGYIVTSDENIKDKIKSIMQPWNTSVPAQMAGCAALEEEAYIKRTVELIKREREYLKSELAKFNCITVYESEADFILFRLDTHNALYTVGYVGDYLYDKLLEHGIMIRKCDDFEGLALQKDSRYYRTAVRKHEENVQLIRTLQQILMCG
jgi:threonine-phosphate decarboxylase